MTRVASLPPGALPRPVKPFPGEIFTSYLARLAHANRLDPGALRRYITGGGRRRPVPVDRLSVVTGLPDTTLRHAIPDLDAGPVQPAAYLNGVLVLRRAEGSPCRACLLARGITLPVRCWKPPEKVICLRHRRWIGPAASAEQPDLTGQPDILQAHKRHLRLVRRFGRSDVAVVLGIADQICRRWVEQRQYDEGFCERMRIFRGPDWKASSADPAVAAAIYPQAVALARLLVSPYWQSLAHLKGRGKERFLREVHTTVAPGYPRRWPQRYPSADPLRLWLLKGRLANSPPGAYPFHDWPGPA
jgi:TniQ